MVKYVDIPLRFRNDGSSERERNLEIIEAYRLMRRDTAVMLKKERQFMRNLNKKVIEGVFKDPAFVAKVASSRYVLLIMSLYGRSCIDIIDYLYDEMGLSTKDGYNEEHCEDFLQVIKSDNFFLPLTSYAIIEFVDTIDYNKVRNALKDGTQVSKLPKATGLHESRVNYIRDRFIKSNLSEGNTLKVGYHLGDYLTDKQVSDAKRQINSKNLSWPMVGGKLDFSQFTFKGEYLKAVLKLLELMGSVKDEYDVTDISFSEVLKPMTTSKIFVNTATYLLFNLFTYNSETDKVVFKYEEVKEALVRSAILENFSLGALHMLLGLEDPESDLEKGYKEFKKEVLKLPSIKEIKDLIVD